MVKNITLCLGGSTTDFVVPIVTYNSASSLISIVASYFLSSVSPSVIDIYNTYANSLLKIFVTTNLKQRTS